MRVHLADQLPSVLASDPFVRSLTSVFDHVNDSVLAHADGIEWLADIALAPDDMVRWMTTWLGVGWDEAILPAKAHTLLRSAGATYAARGTKRGLERLLRDLVEADVTIVDPGGAYPEGTVEPNDKSVGVVLGSSGGWSDRFFVALLDHELPADVRYTLVVEKRTVVPDRLERGGWHRPAPTDVEG